LAFSELIGEPLEPHERRIARAHFGAEREVYAIMPRGNLKTTLAAKVGLHHLLVVPGGSVTLGAASRDQARICFERMRGFAQHPALEDQLVIRHLELRHEEDDGHLRLLRVVPSDGPRAHGLSSTLYIGDELWAWAGDELLEAMLTGLVKNPVARFLGISSSANRLDGPLGRMRTRALAGKAGAQGRRHRRDSAGDALARMVAAGGQGARRLSGGQGVQPRELHHRRFAARAGHARDTDSLRWGKVTARAGLEFDFYLATKHFAVHYLYAELGLAPRVIAEQMGWSLAGVLKLLAVYGHGDVGALEEIDAAFARNVTPLRAVEA
jgi:Terminase large subunit, ATPase domain